MAKRDYITVEELNFYINNIFLNEELLHNVPVVGEVSGCSVSKGHCYFTLKDDKAQIRVVLFNCAGKFVPNNGMKVLVRGSVDYYTKTGQINVKAYEVVYFGIGILSQKLEELKAKLSEEGLFREDHKKEIPLYPQRIAIITSINGAAVQDFITTVRRYNSVVDISIIDVRVQGDGCASDIICALNNADEYGFDVIVLARGGGSFEDLFQFNDEALVRKIYEMKTPIISAIGHETDYTLCDFVADYRAITPTAAAEKVGYSLSGLKSDIMRYCDVIKQRTNDLLERVFDDFSDLCDDLKIQLEILVNKQKSLIMSLLNKARGALDAKYSRDEEYLRQTLIALERLNPLKLLNNGYFRIIKDQFYVYGVKELKSGDKVEVLGGDGKVDAIILSEGE